MVRLRVLGTIEAIVDGRPVDLGGPRQRAVLAILLTRRGGVVSTEQLLEWTWGGEPPGKAITSLQAYISNLRRVLEPDRAPHAPAQFLVRSAPGYALRLPADAVDAWRFESVISAAHTAEPEAAWQMLTEALGWWAGPAYGPFRDEPWAIAEAARLDGLHLTAREALIEAASATGRFAEAVAAAELLTPGHPLREESRRLLAAGPSRTSRRHGEPLSDGSGPTAAEVTVRRNRHLRGRDRELTALTEMRTRALGGVGGALVVRGTAGIGKTSLIEQVVASAAGLRVLRATGVEFEVGLPYSGLLQLLSPLTGGYDSLPVPQRHALEVAAGRREGARPDLALVAMATLTLLSAHAQDGPLLAVIDDAQWLDQSSARVLAFVGRRLATEPIMLLFGVREPAASNDLAALPALPVGEIADADARLLLADALPVPLEDRVAARILAESRGNPLTLLELARTAGPHMLAGGFDRPVSGGASEELFRADLAGLPEATRLLLLVAAAEPLGDPGLLWSAARVLGLAPEELTPAEDGGLVSVDLQVRFRHPLVRSAAYHSASVSDRRRAHLALAEATDPAADPDRHVWHRALAATGTDEPLAAELALAAQRVRARGGVAAAAVFLEHAARLTPDPWQRRERVLTAATDRLESGAPAEAQRLLSTVDAGGHAATQARMELLRGRIAFAQLRGKDAAEPLRRAAELLEPLNPGLAREVHLDALTAATAIGALGGVSLREAVRFARGAVRPTGPATTADLLLDGLIAVLGGDHPAGLDLFRQAVARSTDDDWPSRLKFAAAVMWELWDLTSYERLLDRQIARARAVGNLTRLPDALDTMAGVYLRQGRFAEAASVLEQAGELAGIAGTAPGYPQLVLAAWTGDPGTVALFDAAVANATARGEGLFVGYAHYALAGYHNGRGDYAAAARAAAFADRHLDFGFRGIALRELVEAAARAGDRTTAEQACERLRIRTGPAGTDFASGTQALCAALTTTGDDADTEFRVALEALGRSGLRADHARAELLYGEWLRREGRRTDARGHLRSAHAALLEMGADGFARRAAREMAATGERARSRSAQAGTGLTGQELTIARLVAGGATSKEVSAELFVSPRTVDAHLRNIFRKLGITSRRQLRDLPQYGEFEHRQQ
ncbi:putative SARP-family transcriptional regulator [Actinoplanes missouriensis 431]|uniref:Putative SARP-family transcriptional regulator n=2 Tax=Actinoplanes missouriensis TaxID=1866 RepID=I0HJH0_ACTM4|nr:putative SARP-family transcriptional regulator [Actinoplanes missouriensis 431]